MENTESRVHTPAPEPEKLRIDVGCGKNPKEGFVGIDSIDFGQKYVLDVRNGLPFADDSVDEVHSSHFVEHLDGPERVGFFNELHRVMKKGATALIITPNWSHPCAFGDPTHKFPPLSGWYPLYLNKAWRDTQAPHCGYSCDFDHVIAGSWDAWLEPRNQEFKQFAMNQYINSWRDLICTFTKR